jgi:UDP-glucose 4-epimerase
MPKALVTGAGGFMGSHVAAHCRDLGFDVVAIDDLSGGFRENIPAGVRFQRASITDVNAIERLWAQEGPFDFVYHLAAYAAEGLSHFIRRFNYTNNLLGSVNLINAAVLHGCECFIFTSSIAVYGANQLPMTEETTPRPEDPYGISKLAVELDLQAAHDMFGLDFVTFRPHNVYGERQNISDPYRNVVGIFMAQALRGQPMTIFGDGQQTRAFSYIDDVAQPIARAPLVPEARNQIFNTGADEPVSVLVLAEMIADVLDVPLTIDHQPARREVVDAWSDHRKARRVFGLGKPTSLGDGLTRMANWVRTVQPHPPITFDEVEIPKNLPLRWRDLVIDGGEV